MKSSVDDLRVFLFLIGLEAFHPSFMSGFLHKLCHRWQSQFAVAENGEGWLHILAQFGWVNLEMYDFSLLGIGLQVACHSIIEAHTNGDEKVALIGHHIWSQVAMHTKHAHIQRMVGRNG